MESASAPPVAFDWRALVEAVDPRASREFVRMLRAQGRARRSVAVGVVIAVVVVFAVAGAFFSVVVGVVAEVIDGGGPLSVVLAVAPLLLFAGVVALVLFLTFRGGRMQAGRWFRLDRFARANGMTFVPSIPEPHLPGMIFGRGSNRESTDLVRGAQPRFVEFANYRFVTGSGKNQTTHRWGYVAVKLDVPLPHIILDATGNNGLFGSNLPMAFDRDQRLSLEGDFDRYFSLYCPSGYERDALYLFTPDIMARFIDNAAQLDVEIVDDWLFLYAKRDLATLDPATWGWLFTVVAALLDKFAQWSRWRDDRLTASALSVPPPSPPQLAMPLTVPDAAASGIPGAGHAGPAPFLTPPPPGVAPPGRRLQTRVSWVSIVVFLGVGFFILFSNLGGWALLLGR